MISTPLIVFTKQSLWLANYRDKKGIYIKKYKRKDLMWSRQNRGDFAPKLHEQYMVRNSHLHGLVRNSHLVWAGAKFALSLMQLSSEGHIFLILAPKSYTVWSVGFLTSWDLKWYISCRKWTSGSAPKVWRKTEAAVLCFLHSVFLSASLLYLACLNEPKSCQNTKTSHKYD